LLDFAAIIERATAGGWSVVAVEQSFDMARPEGRMLAGILATFAQYERDLISARTRDALAVKRAQGVHCGRRSTLPPEVRERIRRERQAGATWQRIADRLNLDRIPTGQGGSRWRPSSVRAAGGYGR
jgi:DNA invertase Pin-like site-specific DNA recombinase